MDKNSETLKVYGLSEQLKLAKSTIESWLDENKEIEKRILLEESKMIGYLIGQNSSRIIKLRNECGANFSFSGKEENPSYVVIKGVE